MAENQPNLRHSKTRIIISLLAVVLFLASCGNTGGNNESTATGSDATVNSPAANPDAAVATVKKYGIKSGIATFESTGLGLTQKVVLYFDDFGAREAEEKYNDDNSIKETSLCDGTNRYTLVYKDKTALNNGACYRGIAYKFDLDEVSKADQKYKVQKLANISIAGKDCESFSLESSGNTITYAGWNNVCLLIDQATQYGKITYKAISFEENAVIPADKLKVPSDFQIK